MQVLYVEPPFSPLHLAGGLRRGRKRSRKPRPSGEINISLLSPFTLLPHQNQPLLRSRFVLANWMRFATPGVRSALISTAFYNPSLIICGTALYSALALSMPAKVRAYRLADDERLFASSSHALIDQAKAHAAQFDVVLATTTLLAASAEALGVKRIVQLPNGVDPKRFLASIADRPPDDLARIPAPRIIYAGATETWFDWQTLTQAATELPSANVVILNTSGAMPTNLPGNIHILGRKPHDALANYMTHCDAGIIPFRLESNAAAIAAIDPIKLWEYLACGLPVVASNQLDLVPRPGSIWHYKDGSGFVECLKAALIRGRRANGIADIEGRTWTQIVAKALENIFEDKD